MSVTNVTTTGIKPIPAADPLADCVFLGEGTVFPASFEQTGINQNVLVLGSTGCGKTLSYAYPRALHLETTSLVIPLNKRKMMLQVRESLLEKGYRVEVLDLTHPEKSTVRFDPLDYVKDDDDIEELAQAIVNSVYEKGHNDDPFWSENSKKVIKAVIKLETIQAKEMERRPSFWNVLELLQGIELKTDEELCSSNMDSLFEKAQERYPESNIGRLWKQAVNISPKTASCLVATISSCVSMFASPNLKKLMNLDKYLPIEKLGEERTVLFIINSCTNEALLRYANLLYGNMFRILMETAEEKESGSLDIPVHLILDDAAACRVPKLETHISMFRAAGLSVSILLQSMNQLHMLYGDAGAVTIQDNCDTSLFLSVNPHDLQTCKELSASLNRSVNELMNLPLGKCIILRRGMKTKLCNRYQILDDPAYREIERPNCSKDTDVSEV